MYSRHITVFQLQGYLFFGNATILSAKVESVLSTPGRIHDTKYDPLTYSLSLPLSLPHYLPPSLLHSPFLPLSLPSSSYLTPSLSLALSLPSPLPPFLFLSPSLPLSLPFSLSILLTILIIFILIMTILMMLMILMTLMTLILPLSTRYSLSQVHRAGLHPGAGHRLLRRRNHRWADDIHPLLSAIG